MEIETDQHQLALIKNPDPNEIIPVRRPLSDRPVHFHPPGCLCNLGISDLAKEPQWTDSVSVVHSASALDKMDDPKLSAIRCIFCIQKLSCENSHGYRDASTQDARHSHSDFCWALSDPYLRHFYTSPYFKDTLGFQSQMFYIRTSCVEDMYHRASLHGSRLYEYTFHQNCLLNSDVVIGAMFLVALDTLHHYSTSSVPQSRFSTSIRLNASFDYFQPFLKSRRYSINTPTCLTWYYPFSNGLVKFTATGTLQVRSVLGRPTLCASFSEAVFDDNSLLAEVPIAPLEPTI